MRLIDADVLFRVLDDRIKEAEEEARHARRDVVAERADAVLSTLERLKADIEDDVTTIRGRWTGRGNTFITCSDSGECTEVAGNYCPFCGAKLEGDE